MREATSTRNIFHNWVSVTVPSRDRNLIITSLLYTHVYVSPRECFYVHRFIAFIDNATSSHIYYITICIVSNRHFMFTYKLNSIVFKRLTSCLPVSISKIPYLLVSLFSMLTIHCLHQSCQLHNFQVELHIDLDDS